MEQSTSRDQLYRADEVFATGTTAEVVVITGIAMRKIGEGRIGSITLTPVQAPASVSR